MTATFTAAIEPSTRHQSNPHVKEYNIKVRDASGKAIFARWAVVPSRELGTPAVIEVQGRFYVAQEVVNSVCSYSHSAPLASVKYGPGGRRLYVPVTEGLVDHFAQTVAGGARSTAKNLERGEQIKAFAVTLIDFLR